MYRMMKWKKNIFKISDLIGKRFNTYFEIENQKLIPLEIKQVLNEPKEQSSEEDEGNNDNNQGNNDNNDEKIDLEKDNRDLYDNNNAQRIGADEIAKFKAEGGKAKNLIAKLKENSQTFEKKTLFSQEKYIKKKKSK